MPVVNYYNTPYAHFYRPTFHFKGLKDISHFKFQGILNVYFFIVPLPFKFIYKVSQE